MANFKAERGAHITINDCSFATTVDLRESDVIEAINNIANGLNTLASTVYNFLEKFTPAALTVKSDIIEDIEADLDESSD